VAAAAREGLLAMSVAIGLRVMAELTETELAAKVGPKHAKQPRSGGSPAHQRARLGDAGRAAGAGPAAAGTHPGRP
jgi:hypothetical protein